MARSSTGSPCPDEYIGLTIDAVSARLRDEHEATLLSVNRGGRAFVNPKSDFVLEQGDDAIVVAESLGTLAPLKLHDLHTRPADGRGRAQRLISRRATRAAGAPRAP